MMAKGIVVSPGRLGRLTAWKVQCRACDLTVWPCRRKVTAISLANKHSADFHQEDGGVVLVRRPA
jgi:hypothetical protein